MIFSLFRGNARLLSTWQSLLEAHTGWLRRHIQMELYSLPDGEVCALIWVCPNDATQRKIPQNRDSPRMICAPGAQIRTSPEELLFNEENRERSFAPLSSSQIHLWVDSVTGEINIWVPPTATQQVFYAIREDSLVISNDLRWMLHWSGGELDPRAVYALLHYRAVPPPLTLLQNVARLPYGRWATFPPHRLEAMLRVDNFLSEPFHRYRDEAEALFNLRCALDACLQHVPARSVLFFSGGVDSGLLAARLAALGRDDIPLLHLSFSSQGAETELAKHMADHLGLRLHIVTYRSDYVGKLLETLAREYAFPFGDLSLTPTHMLVNAALHMQEAPGCVIEGTGGDGAFGLTSIVEKWSFVYRIPTPFRTLLGSSYRVLGLWQSPSSSEARLRKVRRSLQMPLPHAAILGNTSLDGVAYTMPREVACALQRIFSENFEPMAICLDVERQMVLMDLVHVCAGRYAAKSSEPLHQAGIPVIYPYLESEIIRLSLGMDAHIKKGKKELLKRLLNESVPTEMIFRPKESFLPPLTDLFLQSELQAALNDCVLARNNPLRVFFERKVVQRMIQRTAKGDPLSLAAYNLLWSLTFASLWWEQCQSIQKGK